MKPSAKSDEVSGAFIGLQVERSAAGRRGGGRQRAAAALSKLSGVQLALAARPNLVCTGAGNGLGIAQRHGHWLAGWSGGGAAGVAAPVLRFHAHDYLRPGAGHRCAPPALVAQTRRHGAGGGRADWHGHQCRGGCLGIGPSHPGAGAGAGAGFGRQHQATSELAKAASALINLLALAVLYALFGGGWALRAWFGERARWQALQHDRALAALKAQKRQSDLHLSALQAQIEPHFLFNTLASLRALIISDPPAAGQLLDAMTDYLRAAMPAVNHSDKTIGATLGDQLDLCARYLELMRLRLGGRLQYKVSAGDDVRALEFPPLLILTLVENAIKHGIEPHSGNGRIELAARHTDNVLTIEVRDNGAGLQPGTTSGVGLANVRAQLQTRFGKQAGLELSSGDGWTAAVMRIPLEATDE